MTTTEGITLTLGILASITSIINTFITKKNSDKTNKAEREVKPIKDWWHRKQTKAVYVLMMDDNPNDVDLVGRMVTDKMNLPFFGFYREEDFKRALTNFPNVIILDHYLPKGYGADMVDMLNKLNLNNFIIIYTGAEDNQVAKDYNNTDIDGYVDKNNTNRLALLEALIEKGLKKIKNL